jgi:glycosyltransferase involved in cell wall biosynthesis
MFGRSVDTGVDVLIPAHNEERTIGDIVKACKSANWVNNVYVVADLCSDNTVHEAHKYGATVLETSKGNKADAVHLGAQHCDEYILLLDGDLVGLLPRHVETLATKHPWSMVVGIRGKEVGKLKTIPPIGRNPIGGERRLPKQLLMDANIAGSGYRMEVRLNKTAKSNFVPIDYVWLDGVGQIKQYGKWGFKESFRKDITRWKDVVSETIGG